MVTVAVAGGAGKLGLTIVEHLSENSKHNVIILSRQPETEAPPAGVPVLVVDYNDVNGLLSALNAQEVHTIISTIQVNSPESGASELNLVEAASKSTHTKRFISSEWAVPITDPKFFLPHNPPRLATMAKLRTTNLEWTTVYDGQIMDCIGTPRIKSHMGVYSLHLDMVNRVASIPGTGNELMTFTYSYDIARFVEVLLDMPRWEEETFISSDVCTYNDVLKIAEEALGKFDVTYDPLEKLEKGEMTELPSHASLYPFRPKALIQARFSMFGVLGANGLMYLPEEKTLNKRFPHIKTMSMEEMISVWKGK